jgi:hypothetical protein
VSFFSAAAETVVASALAKVAVVSFVFAAVNSASFASYLLVKPIKFKNPCPASFTSFANPANCARK